MAKITYSIGYPGRPLTDYSDIRLAAKAFHDAKAELRPYLIRAVKQDDGREFAAVIGNTSLSERDGVKTFWKWVGAAIDPALKDVYQSIREQENLAMNGYEIRKDVASGMVILSRPEWKNEVAFGGVPAIVEYAAEHPEVPHRVIDELLGRDAGFDCSMSHRAGWLVCRAIDHPMDEGFFAPTEDESWALAAEEAVRRHEASTAVMNQVLAHPATATEAEEANALGFESVEAMRKHERFLDEHGTPEYKEWKGSVRAARDLPFLLTENHDVNIYAADSAVLLPKDWVGIAVDGSDTTKFWLIGQTDGERSFTRLQAKNHVDAVAEVVAVATQKLPDFCLVVIPERGPGQYVAAIRRGEKGVLPTDYRAQELEQAEGVVAHVNRRLGVTPLQAACMHSGSRLGWDAPESDPGFMAKMLKGRGPSELSTRSLVFTEANWKPAEFEQAKGRIVARRTSALDALTPAQRSALVAFRNTHGRYWKTELHEGWMRAAFPGELQQIRNEFGSTWLNKLTPSDFDFAKGLQESYGVLKDGTAESLSFLDTIDGVVVGRPDTTCPDHLRHVKLTMDAMERVREFPADFVFLTCAKAADRENGVSVGAMSSGGLVAESAHLAWCLHAPGTDAQKPEEVAELRVRYDEVTAEATRRVKEVILPFASFPSAAIESPAL